MAVPKIAPNGFGRIGRIAPDEEAASLQSDPDGASYKDRE
jgi:hypothetical protein